MLKIKKLAGRCLALLLAGTFLLSDSAPLLETARAAEDGGLTLRFSEGKDLIATMIRGQSVKVVATNTDIYSINRADPLRLYLNNAQQQDVTSSFTITPLPSLSKDEIFEIRANAQLDTRPNADADIEYVINANYTAMRDEASAVHAHTGAGYTPGDPSSDGQLLGTNIVGDLKLSKRVAVNKRSVAHLRYEKKDANTPGQLVYYKTEEEADGGIFNQWTVDKQAVTLHATNTVRNFDDDSPNPITYNISIPGLQDFEYMQFTPRVTYTKTVPVLGADGKPTYEADGVTPITTQQLVYGFREGENFENIFEHKQSDQLLLTVLGQEKFLKDLAGRAKEPTQVVQGEAAEFIRLGRETDELNFITENFSLRETYVQYNTKVRISWEFKADDEQYNDVVKISGAGTADWKNVTITPRREDVTGKLIATFTYVPESFFPMETPITAEVPITIHGTGDPAVIQKINLTIGQSGEQSLVPTFPNTLNMDKYRGGIDGYPDPEYPYMATFVISPGRENGFARQIVIESSQSEALTATIQRGSAMPVVYEFGSTFDNAQGAVEPEKNPEDILFTIYANQKGLSTKLNFRFFIAAGGGTVMEDPRAAFSINVSVTDTSPDETAQLSELTIRDKANNRVDIEGFAFSPETYDYSFNIDYEIQSVIMKPSVFQKAQKDIGVKVEYYNDLGQWIEAENDIWEGKEGFSREWFDDYHDRGNPDKALPSFKSGQWGGMQVNLTPGQTVRVTYKVRAENPNVIGTYVIEMTRNLPSDDSTLKSLQLVDEEGTDHMVPIVVGQLEYEIHVPYRTKMLQVLPELSHAGAVIYQYDPKLQKKELFGSENWLKTFADDAMEMWFSIDIEAQNKVVDDQSHYKIHIIRDEPSDISTAATLEVTDVEGNVLTLDPAFAGVLEDANAAYTVRVPYVTNKVRLRVKTDDPYASVQAVYWINNSQKEYTQEMTSEALSKAIEVPVMSETAPYYEILVVVTAESGKQTVYKVHVERAEPDTDAYLAGLDLKDLEGELQDFENPFDPEVLNYDAIVLYATNKVTVTPTTSSPTATVTVNGRKVTSGEASANIRLDYPGYNEIEVKVTAQDEVTTMTYKIRVKRADPSTDSRLRALEVSDVDRLKPVFRPQTLQYTANVNEGVTEVKVTATTNDPFATLQIDGKDAVSGQPSEPIVLLDVYQTVTITVTAQDGKSVTVYEVDLYNPNMVEKSSNADLADLKVVEGLMEPKFAPSVTNYEVYVKEDAYSVEIIPTPADPMAKVQVFAGTLEIGDEEGNFSQSIIDGENEFSVRVTAPDESKHKDYTIIVYRNVEEKMGKLQPITAEDIDWENSGDIIVVDITKYTRVAADVFNTLKTEYPEKTIIFEGNDYSLQFDAADIQKLIPHTEVFDFALSFTSPYRDEIMRKINRYSENDDARVVLVHFGDSKELPAPARFTLSLGRKYRDDRLSWHYWNNERSRIDFYGTVDTNSKGTFAVKLERLGDYIVADQRLAGSEDKSTALAADGDLSKDTSLLKTNPNTGSREGER